VDAREPFARQGDSNVTNTGPTTEAEPQRQLSLFDTTSIIVGIIIGSGLYSTAPLIAAGADSKWMLFGIWAIGALFALVGSLCYAELATTYPLEGGDFVFLSRAYGRRVGFVYAWCQLWVIRPGSIGAMALVFASYAREALGMPEVPIGALAVAAVLSLAGVNMLGVRQGKWTQNVLSSAKVLGLLAVIAVGFSTSTTPPVTVGRESSWSNLSLALLLVMFTYSGWNEMPNVAAEVRDPRKNILRALVLGAAAVAAIYVLVNAAFVHALGLAGVQASHAVATDTVATRLGSGGGRAVSVLICLSALGAMNGMTMTGSRVYYAFGRQHTMFAWLGRWHSRLGTPVNSLATEAAITVAMIITLTLLYDRRSDPFERLVALTGTLFWIFLTLSSLSLFILRRTDGARERPFRVPFYPVLPAAFAIVCAAMAWMCLAHAWKVQPWEGLWAMGMLTAGAVLAARERSADS
jgi:amino acid transporter